MLDVLDGVDVLGVRSRSRVRPLASHRGVHLDPLDPLEHIDHLSRMTDPQLPLFPGVGSKRMGELRRGAASWDVFLECQTDRTNGATHGRIHFVSGGRTLTSAWIFLEWTARDVEERFHEFAAAELWGLAEGIAD